MGAAIEQFWRIDMRRTSTKRSTQRIPFFLATGVLALLAHVFGGACLCAGKDDVQATSAPANPRGEAESNRESLPAGALVRLGTLRWRHGDVISYVAFHPNGKAVLTAG